MSNSLQELEFWTDPGFTSNRDKLQPFCDAQIRTSTEGFLSGYSQSARILSETIDHPVEQNGAAVDVLDRAHYIVSQITKVIANPQAEISTRLLLRDHSVLLGLQAARFPHQFWYEHTPDPFHWSDRKFDAYLIPKIQIIDTGFSQTKTSGDLVGYYKDDDDFIFYCFDAVTFGKSPDTDILTAQEIRNVLPDIIANRHHLNFHSPSVVGIADALHTHLLDSKTFRPAATGAIVKVTMNYGHPDHLEIAQWGDTQTEVLIRPTNHRSSFHLWSSRPSSFNPFYDTSTVIDSHMVHDESLSLPTRLALKQQYKSDIDRSRELKTNPKNGCGVGIIGQDGHFSHNINTFETSIPVGPYDYAVVLHTDGLDNLARSVQLTPVQLAMYLHGGSYYPEVTPLFETALYPAITTAALNTFFNRHFFSEEVRPKVDDTGLAVLTRGHPRNWVNLCSDNARIESALLSQPEFCTMITTTFRNRLRALGLIP